MLFLLIYSNNCYVLFIKNNKSKIFIKYIFGLAQGGNRRRSPRLQGLVQRLRVEPRQPALLQPGA